MSEEILRKKPTIEIEGITYTIRRPGLSDCFALPRILADIQIHAGHNVKDFYEPVPILDDEGKPVKDKRGNPKIDHQINIVAMVFSLASGVPEAEGAVTSWIASMLIKPDGEALTIEEAMDPDVLPLTELPPLIEKLAAIPDFITFFARSVHAKEVIRELWPSKSGKSNDQPDGRTSKSAESHTQDSSRSEPPKQNEHSERDGNG